MATLDIYLSWRLVKRRCLNTTVSAKRSASTTYPFNIIRFTSHTLPTVLLNTVCISILFPDYITRIKINVHCHPLALTFFSAAV